MKLYSKPLYAVLRRLVIEDVNRCLRAGKPQSGALKAAVEAVEAVDKPDIFQREVTVLARSFLLRQLQDGGHNAKDSGRTPEAPPVAPAVLADRERRRDQATV